MRRAVVAVVLMLGSVLFNDIAADAAWKTPPDAPAPPAGGRIGVIQQQVEKSKPIPPNVGPGRRGLALPANSGAGRRAVYSNSMQHVWIVEGSGRVIRDYDVSGRRGMPSPGTYKVYSRSRYSSSGSLSLPYMVRFARGSRLAIGFHQIPVRPDGSMIQSYSQLGTPLSHGCVRQSAMDAAFMWDWGQLGTVVVVLP